MVCEGLYSVYCIVMKTFFTKEIIIKGYFFIHITQKHSQYTSILLGEGLGLLHSHTVPKINLNLRIKLSL